MPDNLTYFTPKDLPLPWKLNPSWFDRLELSEEHRRRYSHLSPREVMLIESARLVAEQYILSGIRQEGKSTAGLVRRLAEELDRNWLKKGYGRAVDIKTVLEVLERYAEYCRWVKSFKKGALEILEIDIPYFGPGILTVKVTLMFVLFGKHGETRWANAEVTFHERKFIRTSATENATEDSFTIDPNDTKLVEQSLSHWTSTMIERAKDERTKFLSDAMHKVGREIWYPGSLLGRHGYYLTNPTPNDLDLILDLVSMYAHQKCFPVKPKHQLVFDVADDLSKIDVRKIETERWLRRDELPPLVSPLTT